MLAVAGGILLAMLVLVFLRQLIVAFVILLVAGLLALALLPVLGRL